MGSGSGSRRLRLQARIRGWQAKAPAPPRVRGSLQVRARRAARFGRSSLRRAIGFGERLLRHGLGASLRARLDGRLSIGRSFGFDGLEVGRRKRLPHHGLGAGSAVGSGSGWQASCRHRGSVARRFGVGGRRALLHRVRSDSADFASARRLLRRGGGFGGAVRLGLFGCGGSSTGGVSRRWYSMIRPGRVPSTNSGVSERPQPRDRSPPKPVSASRRKAAFTGSSHWSRACVVLEADDGPQAASFAKFDAGGGVAFGGAAQTIYRGVPADAGAERTRLARGYQAGAGAIHAPLIVVEPLAGQNRFAPR